MGRNKKLKPLYFIYEQLSQASEIGSLQKSATEQTE